MQRIFSSGVNGAACVGFMSGLCVFAAAGRSV